MCRTLRFRGGSNVDWGPSSRGLPITRSEQACLAIADISGYTEYLSGVELDHAQDVLMDLLSTVVEPLRPDFHLAKLEGDAVFMYAPVDSIDGSILLDRIETCYFDFQRRLLTITQATTCECDACIRIPELDLKIVVHHGSIIRHEVLGSQELVGTDVIVVHRLLKNRIVEDLGISAYALLTDACLEATSLDAARLGMLRYEDSFDGIGTVGGWVHDLALAWQDEHDRQRTYVRPDGAVWTDQGLVPGVPVSLVWEWLTMPSRRLQWEVGFDDIVEFLPEGGRRGPGTETHCAHGENLIKNAVLDWRPPRYVTNYGEFPDGTPYIVTDEAVEDERGVIVRKSLRAPTDETRPALELILEVMRPSMETMIPTLIELVTQDHASRPSVDEPEIPTPDTEARLADAVQSPDGAGG